MSRVDHYNDPNAPQANSLRVAVSAFVLDDAGRLLMIRRTDNDLYAIPGGQPLFGPLDSVQQLRSRPPDEARHDVFRAVALLDLRNPVRDRGRLPVRRCRHVRPPQRIPQRRLLVLELRQLADSPRSSASRGAHEWFATRFTNRAGASVVLRYRAPSNG